MRDSGMKSVSDRVEVRGKGPAVLFIHGVGLDRRMWAEQLQALGATHTVVTYDLPGHGADAGNDSADNIDLDGYVADLAGLMDKLGCARAVLVGAAFGGAVARRFAIRHPDRVAALALLSQIARRSAAASRSVLERYRSAAEEGIEVILEPALERWLSADFRLRHPQAGDLVRDMVMRTRRQSFLQAYKVFATTDEELAGEANRINCPALLVSGEDDMNSTPADSHALAMVMPEAEVVILPRVRHLISIEAPERLNLELLRFLEERGQQKAQ